MEVAGDICFRKPRPTQSSRADDDDDDDDDDDSLRLPFVLKLKKINMYIRHRKFFMLSGAHVGPVRVETRQTITFFSSGGPTERNVILKFYDNGVSLPGHVGAPAS
jgi:hypothetical protein